MTAVRIARSSADTMNRRREILAVHAAGMLQGVALVTFPAAAPVLTDPSGYGLSSGEYGALFVPQALMAIAASALGAGLRHGGLSTKHRYLLGLCGNWLAMLLLVASLGIASHHAPAYGVLLLATGCLGAGFGLTVPVLNTLAAAYFPRQTDRAVLRMNALLGLGTALAPVFIAVFVGLGIWWGLPLLLALLIPALLIAARHQPLDDSVSQAPQTAPAAAVHAVRRLWLFGGFALLYGVCETVNGSWAALYMREHFGAATALSSWALTAFWGMITLARVGFAASERWIPTALVWRASPWLVSAALLGNAFAPRTHPALGLALFAAAGVGCAALLPLAISFAQRESTGLASRVAGGVLAAYQAGYGLAAFGVGRLQATAGLPLGEIYAGAAVVGLALGGLALACAPAPASVNRPLKKGGTTA